MPATAAPWPSRHMLIELPSGPITVTWMRKYGVWFMVQWPRELLDYLLPQEVPTKPGWLWIARKHSLPWRWLPSPETQLTLCANPATSKR